MLVLVMLFGVALSLCLSVAWAQQSKAKKDMDDLPLGSQNPNFYVQNTFQNTLEGMYSTHIP